MQDLGISILLDGCNLIRLLESPWVTVRIVLLPAAISMVLGVLLGTIMTLKNLITKVLSRVYLETVRIMPQLVLLFPVYFGVTKTFGVHLSGEVSVIIVLVFWGTAGMGDLVRGAPTSIPKYQYESGRTFGLTGVQIYCYIIILQTTRRLLPLAINLATRMAKTTSLVVLTGVVEVLEVGQQIIEANRHMAPGTVLWIYGAIFFLYFLVCSPISHLAGRLEKR